MEQQAQQVWAMLDEMHEENPEAYRKFIEKQLKEGDKFFEAPKSHMSLQTIDYNDDTPVIVYVFEWVKVPAPKSDQDPIPICDGIVLDDKDSTGGNLKVVSVAFHPSVLKEYGRNSSKEHNEMLICLALDSLENLHNMKLSRNFTIFDRKFVGDKKLGMKSLMKSFNKLNNELDDFSKGIQNMNVNDLLKIRAAENYPCEGKFEMLTSNDSKNLSKSLIEEISTKTFAKTPSYEREYSECNGKKVICLKIFLPGVKSSSECRLDASEDDFVLEADELYYLQMDLPNKIDANNVDAKFLKESSCLILTFASVFE